MHNRTMQQTSIKETGIIHKLDFDTLNDADQYENIKFEPQSTKNSRISLIPGTLSTIAYRKFLKQYFKQEKNLFYQSQHFNSEAEIVDLVQDYKEFHQWLRSSLAPNQEENMKISQQYERKDIIKRIRQSETEIDEGKKTSKQLFTNQFMFINKSLVPIINEFKNVSLATIENVLEIRKKIFLKCGNIEQNDMQIWENLDEKKRESDRDINFEQNEGRNNEEQQWWKEKKEQTLEWLNNSNQNSRKRKIEKIHKK